MAAMLRSGKFFRYFAGITRNVVVNSVRDTENGHLPHTSAYVCSPFQQNFSSNAAPKTDLNLEKHLRRLDQDVRRVGRISRRDIEEVLEEIRTQRSATSSQSLLVIRCCGNLVPEEMPEVRTALVQEIWKTLNALNVPMDISHYNALLRVYLENEHPFSPTDLLAEIEAKGIEPNRVTYQRLIARYCQQGDIEGATRILEYMREKNLPVNESVFNSLILGHSQANDMTSAQGILGVMRQASLEPSADTYTTLLCCYARHGQLEEILATLAECERQEILLLDKDLLDVVYYLAINGHGDKVDAVLQKLRLSTGFNQDAVNIVLRLVNKGHEDVGLKIVRLMPRGTRSDGQMVDAGSFFIKQMVRVQRPMEKVLAICKTLQDEGLNPKALLVATEAGLASGSVQNALPLLREMKKAGLHIRQHYFWPLMCSAGAGAGANANHAIDIVRHMQEEFAMNPNAETIREYVIPNLKEKNWDRIVSMLRDVGVPNAVAASSAAYSALCAHQIRDAADIMESYRAQYPPVLLRQPLIQALSKTQDYVAFVRIVRQMHESAQQRQATPESESGAVDSAEPTEASSSGSSSSPPEASSSGSSSSSPDVVGSVVLDACVYFRRDRVQVLERLLPALVKQGLSMSSANATRLSDRLGEELTPKISELLGQMSSGELEPVPLKNAEGRKRGIDTLTVEELERFIARVEAEGENSNNLKRHLMNACFRSKSIEKTLQVIERLEGENYKIGSGQWAQLIDLYAHNGRTSEALALYTKLKAKDPQFQLDNLKTVRMVDLLVKEDRLEEAVKLIESNRKEEGSTESEGTFNYNTTVWRLLNSLAEAGESSKLQRIFEALIAGNFIQPTNVLLGPLIKVHLVKDDLQQAMATFEKICDEHKATPWKNELACRLIQKEDAANLQKLTDLSTSIHGEVNSLYDLVFSFVECGRVRQARKILETPGLRTRPHRIDNACERYKNEGMVEPLEGLVEATKDLSHIDRNNIYYNLLLSYCKAEDADKALGLWTKMQEEAIAPTDAFLLKLSDLLKKKQMDVPFVVPSVQPSPKRTSTASQDKAKSETRSASGVAKQAQAPHVAEPKVPSTLSLFRKAVASGDLEGALQYKSQLQSFESLGIQDQSRLIEQLVTGGRLPEATRQVEELLGDGHFPVTKIFKYYLNKVAAAGDVTTMEQIGAKLPEDRKKLMSFDNRLCHANIVAGRATEYFKAISDEISAAKTPEAAAKLAERFPRGGALGILEKHPEMVPQFKELAEKFAEHNQLGPVNVLWIHLISQGQEAAAKAVWEKHLSSAPRLMFQRVLQVARDHKDSKLAESVIAQLRQSKISEAAIGNAYSCLIDIHTVNRSPDRALETLKTAMKDVCLENINRTALQRLKTALEVEKKEFPFVIPEKRNKANISSSTSSASSDDDVTPHRPETRPTKPSNVKDA